MTKYKVIHYINQFFAQIGGEEMANTLPQLIEGPIGPGIVLARALGDEAELVATVVCGDTYFAENLETVVLQILDLIQPFSPDFVIAGPAFASGRYGISCAAICSAVCKKMKIPAISGLAEGNPGLDIYRQDAYFIKTAANARTMTSELNKIANLALKLVKNEPIGSPEEDCYHPHGIRKNIFTEKNSAQRVIDMLLASYRGEEFTTEIPLPQFDEVLAAPPLTDLSSARIALVTDGGLVPAGNPDRIETSEATRWGYCDISDLSTLEAENYEIVHRGYDNTFVAADPNRLVPVDGMRELEQRKVIGALHHHFFTTTGLITSAANAKRMGSEIAQKMLADSVDAAILTSTWGSSTRCGAVLSKEIERSGIPVTHLCNLALVAQTVGAKRVHAAASIVHPVGAPALDAEKELDFRIALLEEALLKLTIAPE